MTTAGGSTFQNESGLSLQLLVDLQKLCVCAAIHESESTKKPCPNAVRTYFKEAGSCVCYSSRMNLAVRQSSALKQLVLD